MWPFIETASLLLVIVIVPVSSAKPGTAIERSTNSARTVERIILPDATELLDYMLNRYSDVLSNLVVYEDRMLQNINKTDGAIFSQRVMNALIEKGLSREEAYDLVQILAMKSYNEKISLFDLLKKNKKVTSLLSLDEIKSCFSLDYYFKNVDEIYDRCKIK